MTIVKQKLAWEEEEERWLVGRILLYEAKGHNNMIAAWPVITITQ